MPTKIEMVRDLFDQSFAVLWDNVRGLTFVEASFVPPGGYRSVLGTLKHTAGWAHVYRSYAFETRPYHWRDLDWPYGLRDTVDRSQAYLDDVVGWLYRAHGGWRACLVGVGDDELDQERPDPKLAPFPTNWPS